MDKLPTCIRLSEEAKRLRKLLANSMGINESAVLEIAIRSLAKTNGIGQEQPSILADTREAYVTSITRLES